VTFPRLRAGEEADVALLLEGTYPFVSGGVSSWMHQIISHLPELRFALVFIGGSRESYGEARYPLPPNVAHLECHYLADRTHSPRPRRTVVDHEVFGHVSALLDALREKKGPPDPVVAALASSLGREGGLTRADFLHSEQMWAVLRNTYFAAFENVPFVDWFWSVRSMFGPIFRLAEFADGIPPARAFHSISTGYAGVLGALLHHRRGRRFLLTEHGIYTKERKIDLSHGNWVKEAGRASASEGPSSLQRMWMSFFEGMGRIAYGAADPIISLYEANRRRQIADGAPAERTRVISNGAPISRYAALRARREAHPRPVLGFIGRVVPVKDVRTLVRAMLTVVRRLPGAEAWIVGPEDENPEYARECRQLAASLGLQETVKFMGFQKPDDVLPRMGILLLTSITEALPLVLLEAFASGVPAVATDVGACRELIEGRTPEDRALGAAGAVVPIGDADAVAEAAVALLGDEGRWRAAQQAGIARVERHYRDEQMFDSYRAVYREALEDRDGGHRLRAP
jgi:glycosyltransferase involved in cell wall biosynthesis